MHDDEQRTEKRMSVTCAAVSCECGYKFLNITDRGNANHRDIKAFKRYAKELKIGFGIGAKNCPKCGGSLGGSVTESMISVDPGDPKTRDAAATAVRAFLGKD